MRPNRHRHDPQKSLVGFQVGDVRYAVPIAVVREIISPLPLVSLPHAPAQVAGVTHYRGDVIPVLDLRVRFGLQAAAPTRRTKWLVVVSAEQLVALIVDAVTEVFGTPGSALAPAPPLGQGEDARSIAGVTRYDGGLVFVLDTFRFKDVAAPSLPAVRAASILPAGGPLEHEAHKSGPPPAPAGPDPRRRGAT